MRSSSGIDWNGGDLTAAHDFKLPQISFGISRMQRVHDDGIVARSGMAFQDFKRDREIAADLIRTVGRDGIKCVGDGDDPDQQRYFIAADAVRVARTVQRLVVPPDARQSVRKLLHLADNFEPNDRVPFHLLEFFIRQDARLSQHLIVHADLAHVMQRGGSAHLGDFLLVQADLAPRITEYCETRLEWPLVYGSLASTAAAIISIESIKSWRFSSDARFRSLMYC